MKRLIYVAGLALSMALIPAASAQDSSASQSAAEKTPALKITHGPSVEYTSANSAIVAWSTNVSSGTVVKFGTDRNDLSRKAEAPWGALTHRVTLKNLQPDTTYYFQVDSPQGAGTGTQAQSQIQQFQTKPANTTAQK